MDISNFVSTNIMQNPILISAIIAFLYNVIGYLYNCAEAHMWLPYSKSDMAVTLGLFESVFIILNGIGGLSPDLTSIVALVLNTVRGFRQAITTKGIPLNVVQVEAETPVVVPMAVEGVTVTVRNATWITEAIKQRMWKIFAPTVTYDVFLDTWSTTAPD